MGDRDGRYAAYTARLVDSVLTTPGHLQPDLRRAILARAAATASPGGAAAPAPVPPALAGYIDKVALHAYRIADADLGALRQAGNADDALFEVTVAAAVGAALGRLERGLAALTSPSAARSGPHPLSPSPSGGGGTKEQR